MSSKIIIAGETQPKLRSFIKLARLKFLIYSALSYSMGTAFCLYSGFHDLSLGAYLLGLAGVWVIHLMTHFCNEYYDLEADKSNLSFTSSTGGSRILVDGLLPSISSIAAGYIFLFLGFILSLFMPNKMASFVMLTGMFIGWFYTAPPFSFNYNKMGEVSVATTLAFLVPLMGYIIQTGQISFQIIALLIPAFIIQFTRMLIMNLSDYEGDIRVGKYTLTATLGPKKTVQLYGIGQLIGYGILIPLFFANWIPLTVLICVAASIPIAIWQYNRIKNGGLSVKRKADSITFWASTQSALVILASYLGIILNYLNYLPEKNPHDILLLKLLSIPILIVLSVMASQIYIRFKKAVVIELDANSKTD
jgi:1,4-dihydroxy-2-naphthoate octaprenyltransferase